VRPSLRLRLTALYGGLFLLAGAALVAVSYLLVRRQLPRPGMVGTKVDLAPGVAGGAVVLNPEQLDPEQLAALQQRIATENRQLAVRTATEYRDSALHTLLGQSLLALGLVAVVAVLLGWFVAGRILRPLHRITDTARRLSAERLSERIGYTGPDDELKELADTFDGMLERLSGAFDSQRRFVANASHELRTPLSVQRTLVEVALDDPQAPPQVHRLGGALLAVNERTERLIDGLLVLARSDRGLGTVVPVRLDELAEAAVAGCAGLAAERGVTIRSAIADRVVPGDRVLLERLVLNLLQNAIRHNVRGGTAWMWVGHDPALMVRNTGPEVPAGTVGTLFEPFRRGTAERTSAADQGVGLGLSIVRSVARAHGGDVGAEPREGGGLTVRVRLPAARTP